MLIFVGEFIFRGTMIFFASLALAIGGFGFVEALIARKYSPTSIAARMGGDKNDLPADWLQGFDK